MDPRNPTATALQLLIAIEGLAKEWDDDGKHADARTIREKGPRFAADLSELIAVDPASVIPAVQDITAAMLADLKRNTG
ncbi:hypothetical protein [Streptomyces sp. NBC_01314]|uniref:hypothetical protein n=1 Tax=Streptomyces sp. NBC_01314 TaxID=2903821 RepID=UPI00308ED544|nr:hypothetical protein OG622_50305 [Streptomyces sp. NBC_01314]